MSQLQERSTRTTTRPVPDEAVLSEEPSQRQSRISLLVRMLGAIAVLVVGAVHLQQYFADGIDTVPIIGPLFLLNFAGATVIGRGLLSPAARMRVLHLLLALGGIGLAATSFVFLFISEHMPLFGFQDHGYRSGIIVALAAEAVAVGSLAAYLAVRIPRRA
jgi:cytochrome c-type biogenesis protein CcmH/NrfG